MTKGLYGSVDARDGELILAGDSEGYLRIIRLLRAGQPGSIDLRPGTRGGEPIKRLQIAVADGLVEIRFTDGAAVLSGSLNYLERLAQEISLFLEHNDLTEPGMHAHIDAQGSLSGAQVLAETSLALFLAGAANEEELEGSGSS
jgi:hypothetical protein